jgi:hypothetical protein
MSFIRNAWNVAAWDFEVFPAAIFEMLPRPAVR